jgi:hypothetical protein
MSIMQNIFGGLMGGTQQSAPAPQQQVPPGNIPPNAGATDLTNTMVPPGTVAATQEQASPLADFADLWKTDPNTAAPQPMFGNVDPAKLMDAARKTDFAKAIPKETMAAIAAGGQAGVEAFAQAMNTVSQTVYANSAMATTKIVEQALKKQQEAFEAKLPGIIKQHTLSDTLRSENPVFSNPAVQPLISALESQLAVKHPGATAGELTSMAKQYLEGLGSVFSPKAAPTKEEAAAAGETDWSKFF